MNRLAPTEQLRRAIARGVVGFFNDPEQGQQPIVPALDSLCPPEGVAWRVHADVTGMMVGGVAALLWQMLHPKALAGVWDHSDFRRNMHGRLRNTARFIAVTTYGARSDAEQAIERVRKIHGFVHGSLPDGTPYDANDPRLLAFVHVAGSAMFLAGYRRFKEPGMSPADRDTYWREVAVIGEMLGADPVPRSEAEAALLARDFLLELRADQRSRTIRDIILQSPPERLSVLPLQRLLTRSAIDLLPPEVRRLHGLKDGGIARPTTQAMTLGLATTLRWALAPSNNRA
ncbi:oxygenase MpaB family protein [Sphingomonas astaxanthinifaciens]|uniref:Histidine kinase n=1 Tax=Sphingomonas astaxanthinifaciens DSM 22298 TaxID=1123267 RepID=A0ABQ5Z709_9SPHN|nr:oxygenase MpaB family protein [Sphingomonas astaxanthinifaciens]GLR46569.1 histidine kinase [Sphingomonas astaxanthinifaciens DSM 22298]